MTAHLHEVEEEHLAAYTAHALKLATHDATVGTTHKHTHTHTDQSKSNVTYGASNQLTAVYVFI
jgi:hypothetical protein